jgi:hypothetical protein
MPISVANGSYHQAHRSSILQRHVSVTANSSQILFFLALNPELHFFDATFASSSPKEDSVQLIHVPVCSKFP